MFIFYHILFFYSFEVTAKTRESFVKEITRLNQDLELSDNRLQLSLQDSEELQKKYKEKETECIEMEEMLKVCC